MTRKEINKFLANTKVYVNGKSKEIQEKLFSLGYKWDFGGDTNICHIDTPFLYIDESHYISFGCNMCVFTERKHREITAEQILSLEVTEPTYRPFKTKDECWKEMRKHSPFGWFRHKKKGHYEPMRIDISEDLLFKTYFNTYTFADGTPFGILEN